MERRRESGRGGGVRVKGWEVRKKKTEPILEMLSSERINMLTVQERQRERESEPITTQTDKCFLGDGLESRLNN